MYLKDYEMDPTAPFSPPLIFFWPSGMWDLSSLTSDLTHAPCSGSTES